MAKMRRRVKKTGRYLATEKRRQMRLGPTEVIGDSPFGARDANHAARRNVASWRRETLNARLRLLNDHIHEYQAECIDDFMTEEQVLAKFELKQHHLQKLRKMGLPSVRAGAYARIYVNQQIVAFFSALAIH